MQPAARAGANFHPPGQRKVPGTTAATTPAGSGDQRKLAFFGGRDLAGFLVGQLTVEAKAADQGPQFDLVRVPNGLAHLQTDQQGDLLAMLVDQVGEVLEDLAARSWVQPRPGP